MIHQGPPRTIAEYAAALALADIIAVSRADGGRPLVSSNGLSPEMSVDSQLTGDVRKAPERLRHLLDTACDPDGEVHPLHLLVAEDVATNQIVLGAMLDRFGCTYDIANNGLEAIDLIKQGCCYDAVLMDVSMPVMDGLEATAAIRQLGPEVAGVPVIGLTALAAADEVGVMRAAGMDEVLSKPLHLDVLGTTLKGLKHVRQATDESGVLRSVTVPQLETSPIIHADQLLLHLLRLPPGGRRDLEQMVIADLSHWTKSLLSAFAREDGPAVSRARHTLHGICANFGAVALWQSIEELTQLRWDEKSDGVARVRGLLNATVTHIRDVADQTDRRTA